MNEKAHARFRDYLEAFPYFAGGQGEKLKPDEWAVFDAEYERLFKERDQRRLDADERKRFKGLARVLLRD